VYRNVYECASRSQRKPAGTAGRNGRVVRTALAFLAQQYRCSEIPKHGRNFFKHLYV